MKGFWATVCIFFIMLGTIFWGKYNVCREADALINAVEAIKASPTGTGGRIKALHDRWEISQNFIQISTTHRRVEEVGDLIDTLYAYAQNGSVTEYQKTAELLINALDEIKQFEKFSAVNIL